ncbi:MAG: GNAT family N-acetyltransferase [Betaproteobacteria bacterium]|nr:GNAT family N-acetyltransferase [Betaproteobacteria bacterium]
MLQSQVRPQTQPRKALAVTLARGVQEVVEAQRLRYKVFAEEMGARIPGREQGIDSDFYDAHCEHLLVRDTDTQQVVGTYRILNGAKARRIGGFYADEEFDLTRLNHLRDSTVEIGRSCVHRDYRGGTTIALLWAGLANYMTHHGYRYLIGCASIGMADGGHAAASIYHRLQATHLAPVEYRVFPRCDLPLAAYGEDVACTLPPLIKGYVRVGAYICGAPAWDPDFNTADLLMMLPMARIQARYARHFLKAGH